MAESDSGKIFTVSRGWNTNRETVNTGGTARDDGCPCELKCNQNMT